jgi:hypothetical protein
MYSPNKQVGIVDPLAVQQPVQQPVQQMTNVPPAASSLINPFTPQAQQTAQGMFGNQQAMQNSVGAPLMFEDQTGDGKITQADVIKARTKGYKK